MGVGPKTRQVHRERTAPASQPPRGAKQIVIPMTRPQYDDLWPQADRVRVFLAGGCDRTHSKDYAAFLGLRFPEPT
jgi:hypothetical protein